MTSNPKYFLGVDIGASSAKVAVVDAGGHPVGSAISKSGVDYQATAEKLLESALEEAGITRDRIDGAISTGYGRRNVNFVDSTRTEIACHGAGCHFYFPQPLTVIDIGGQDNKIIKLDAHGQRISFKMNRKCAAGTGAFLEEMAMRLDIPLGDMDGLARQSEETVELGSYCTVFTATEILEKIRAGHNVAAIVRGIYTSIAKRILEMDTITETPVMSGGVTAHNPILVEIVSRMVGRDVLVPPNPQLMGALGAALFALSTAGKIEKEN